MSDDSLISPYRSKWNGPGFWSPGLEKQGGTVILVRENSYFEIKKWQRHSSGRIVSVLASLGELNFNLVNIYAPTNLTEGDAFMRIYWSFSSQMLWKLLLVILIALKTSWINTAGFFLKQNIWLIFTRTSNWLTSGENCMAVKMNVPGLTQINL